MRIRTVTIPSDRRVTLSAYVRAWKSLLQSDPSTIVWGWDASPCTAAEALRDFSSAAEGRLNQAIPRIQR